MVQLSGTVISRDYRNQKWRGARGGMQARNWVMPGGMAYLGHYLSPLFYVYSWGWQEQLFSRRGKDCRVSSWNSAARFVAAIVLIGIHASNACIIEDIFDRREERNDYGEKRLLWRIEVNLSRSAERMHGFITIEYPLK